MEAKLTYRVRGDGFTANQILDNPDVNYRSGNDFLKRDWYERLVGVYRPDLGSIHYGTQLSRSWSRSNDFSWRVGMSGVWADSGAGHGVFQGGYPDRVKTVRGRDREGQLRVHLRD